jgi:cytochrome oxidase Cu insertion factor (SCO1/SenC/PrrC family)
VRAAERSDPARAQALALGALAFLLLVTAAWWALALWPPPDAPPPWLARARQVCFNAGPDGLPDASGWLLLVGEPLGMLGVLLAGWGRTLGAGLRAATRSRAGRLALGAGIAAVALGLSAAGARVWNARAAMAPERAEGEVPPSTLPRLDREAPELALLDQRGERIDIANLRGRPALVTFAFGHCTSVCPAVVHEVLEVQARARAAAAGDASRIPRVAIVSLDPWRDTPARLPHLAEQWKVGEDGFVLSGEVAEVEAALGRWQVPHERNPETGDVVHPPIVYVLDASGRIAYASSGGAAGMLALLERVQPGA